jgi:hypothetical protein
MMKSLEASGLCSKAICSTKLRKLNHPDRLQLVLSKILSILAKLVPGKDGTSRVCGRCLASYTQQHLFLLLNFTHFLSDD